MQLSIYSLISIIYLITKRAFVWQLLNESLTLVKLSFDLSQTKTH